MRTVQKKTKAQVVLGVTEIYKVVMKNTKSIIYIVYSLLVYPVGISIFPVGFPYSVLAIPDALLIHIEKNNLRFQVRFHNFLNHFSPIC